MAVRGLLLVLLTCVLLVNAAPSSPPPTSTEDSTWSNEAIFTFIGLFIAVLGIIVTLVLSSSRIRQWLCCPFRCKHAM
ncbi:hypothetical protein GQ44DRAFT_701006 [Phaeosphaeriaceae sp. PMI808]|nr:hypothetical protein GQ44DRAFT_701006 [Phaeosphaeriaceae sp. PMI808]